MPTARTVSKPVALRSLALRDVDDAVTFYLEASDSVASGFVDTLERAFRLIERSPRAGSHRYEFDLRITGLRAFRLKRHPYIVFYVESESTIDVWRVLHEKRDIAAWL